MRCGRRAPDTRTRPRCRSCRGSRSENQPIRAGPAGSRCRCRRAGRLSAPARRNGRAPGCARRRRRRPGSGHCARRCRSGAVPRACRGEIPHRSAHAAAPGLRRRCRHRASGRSPAAAGSRYSRPRSRAERRACRRAAPRECCIRCRQRPETGRAAAARRRTAASRYCERVGRAGVQRHHQLGPFDRPPRRPPLVAAEDVECRDVKQRRARKGLRPIEIIRGPRAVFERQQDGADAAVGGHRDAHTSTVSPRPPASLRPPGPVVFAAICKESAANRSTLGASMTASTRKRRPSV